MTESLQQVVRRAVGITLTLLCVCLLIGIAVSEVRSLAYGAALGLAGSAYCLFSGARQAEAVALVALGQRKRKPMFGAMSRLATTMLVVLIAEKTHVSVGMAIAGLFAWLVILIYVDIARRKG